MNKLFDYEKFKAQIKEFSSSYNEEKPFPFAVFDGLFDETVLDQVNEEINNCTFEKDVRAIEGVEVKTMKPCLQSVAQCLKSSMAVSF